MTTQEPTRPSDSRLRRFIAHHGVLLDNRTHHFILTAWSYTDALESARRRCSAQGWILYTVTLMEYP